MRCPTCQLPFASDAPGQICPRCALSGALALTTTAPANADQLSRDYDLQHEIGRGAMGVVWLARDRTLDRLVAVKVIHDGGNPLLAQRLLREGQAAARLRHPHIVTVHAMVGNGTSTFLVMDYLEGGNLEELLTEKTLPAPTIADITAKLANALAHAHASGLLHRDVKPSNILLDADGSPQLGDFGLAAPVEGAGELTLPGHIAGTPAYLAPELLAGAEHASPASDVYGLGSVLYRCLTGRAPFVGSSAAAILTQLREAEPIAPRLLQPEVPRDLETICLKCLQKSPAQRYESAAALEADLRRFLAGEPIRARPVSRAEKIVRWANRHHAATAAIGLAAVVLFLLAVGGPLVAVRLDRSRRAAEAARAQAADEAAISQEVVEFLQNDLLAQASPDHEPDRDLKLRAVLDRAARKIEGRFADQPRVEAAIRGTLGQTYESLGEYAAAQHHLERALQLDRQHLGPEDPETLGVMSGLAECLGRQGKLQEAEALALETATIQRRVRGVAHPDTLTTLSILANIYSFQGKYADAEPLLQQVLEQRRKISGTDGAATLTVMNDFALTEMHRGKLAEAEELTAQALVLKKKLLGVEDPRTIATMINLALIYRNRGKLEEAEAIGAEAVNLSRRVLGAEHQTTLSAMGNLAGVYRGLGRFPEAAALNREVLSAMTRTLGPEHPDTLTAMLNLARTQEEVGDFADAEMLISRAVELSRRVRGPEHAYTLVAMATLARTRAGLGRLEEAEALAREVLATRQRVLGPAHPDCVRGANDLAFILLTEGKFAEAEAQARAGLAVAPKALGPAHLDTLQGMDLLAESLLRQGKLAEAEKVARSALEKRPVAPREGWQRFAERSLLGAILIGQGRYVEAEPLLVAAAEGLAQRRDQIPAANRGVLDVATARVTQLHAAWPGPEKKIIGG